MITGLCRSLVVCIGLAAASSAIADDNWPTRPITIIVPSAAGGSTDNVARLVSDRLSQRLGQSIIVENRAGASGVIGLQATLRAPADGYTFVFAYPSNLIASQFIMKDLSFNARRDFVPISGIAINEMVMNVSASVPASNPRELVDWAKSDSGGVTYGSYGHGSYAHMVAHYLGSQNQYEALHAPYKSEQPMLIALASNEISYGISVVTAGKRMQDTGKTRMIGILSPRRSALYPDIPTFKEAGIEDPAFALLGWNGIFAHADTPPAILKKMEAAVRDVMGTAEMKESLLGISSTPWGSTAKELDDVWAAEIPIYRALAESAGVLAQ